MQWKVAITGEKKLDRKLRELEPKLRRKVMVGAMRKGAKLIQQVTKENAPVGEPQPGKPEHQPGTLKKSIKVKAAKRSRRSFGVEVRTSEQDFQGEAYYGAMVEYGTKRQDAQHYLKQTYEQKGPEVRDKVLKEIRAGIDRLASEGGK